MASSGLRNQSERARYLQHDTSAGPRPGLGRGDGSHYLQMWKAQRHTSHITRVAWACVCSDQGSGHGAWGLYKEALTDLRSGGCKTGKRRKPVVIIIKGDKVPVLFCLAFYLHM